MGSIVIDVMLKSEILDPQGQAVRGALPRLGFSGFTDVRQGKRFVLTVDGDVTDEHLAAAREAAEKLLSNPVIEDVVSVRAEGAPDDPDHPAAQDGATAVEESGEAATAKTPRTNSRAKSTKAPKEDEPESDKADESDEDEGEQ
jgi:phosphoribosylformylglycinamidine synthase